MKLPYVKRIKRHFQRTQHVDTAFTILRSFMRDYHYPPTKSDVTRLDVIQKQSARLKTGAAVAFILLTAFGIYYALRPRDAFRFAAKLVLYFAPLLWIAAVGAIIHFWERERCASTLRKWMGDPK